MLGQIAVTQSRFDRHTLSRGLELHYQTMLGQLGDQPNYPEGLIARTHTYGFDMRATHGVRTQGEASLCLIP